MNYLLWTLSIIFLLVLGTIFWLLFLRKKYQEEIFEKKPVKIKIEEIRETKEKITLPKEEKPQVQIEEFLDLKKKVEEIGAKEMENFFGEFKKKMEVFLAEFLEKQKGEIEKIGKESKEIYSNLIEEILKETKDIKKELKEYLMNKIGKETENLFKEFDQTIKEEIKNKFQLTQKEIENYKNEKLKEIDQKMIEILETALEKVGAKIIDLSTHEKLIIDALEKAKAENLFSD